jgi:superfamily II DNA or RNA helicase
MKTLYPRQEQHVDRLISVLAGYGSALDSSETGTGKTICGAEIASRANGNILVVCPKAVIPSWRRELSERGVKADVINYEKLRTGKTKFGKWQNKKWVWTIPPSLIIFDEAHKCSGVGTQNAKMLIEAKDRHAVLMLSATIASSPLQMRAAGWLLGAHMLGNFWQWCMKHGCIKNRWNGVMFNGSIEHIQAIAQSISHRCARMTASELADHFAETQIITEPLQFGDEIAGIYEEMERELAELEDKASNDSKNQAAEALVKQLRARQRVELLKVPVIVEMVDDLVAEGKSVAIFVNFDATLQALVDRWGTTVMSCGVIHGKQSADERQLHIERFQNDDIRIIICNTAAGGVGISLHDVTGKHPRAAIISPDWNEKNIIQVIGRVHRAGGKTPSMQRLLFAAGTIEEQVEKSVRKKINLLNQLNEKSTCRDDSAV